MARPRPKSILSALIGLGVGIGAVAVGSDAATPTLGMVVLGHYAAAVAGVGVAVGGLVRLSVAMGAVAVPVTLTFLHDTFAPALKLPDWVRQLPLTSHLVLPMVGSWDGGGIVACLALAAGGLMLSAWGLGRRDVSM
jgi:polyether ionophore transport system permease protein